MFTLDFSKQYISVSPVLMSIYDKAKFSKYESLRLFCKFIFKVCKIFSIGHIVKKEPFPRFIVRNFERAFRYFIYLKIYSKMELLYK